MKVRRSPSPRGLMGNSPISPSKTLPSQLPQDFLNDVLAGLAANPKTLPCKYFYDEKGAKLFDRICRLDEYYHTRTELAILNAAMPEICRSLGKNCLIIEFGTGSGVKTRLLLDHVPDPAGYVAIDLSSEQLSESARQLRNRYPSLEIWPLAVDFTEPFDLPPISKPNVRRIVFFPGSTISNFGSDQAIPLLKHMAQLAAPGGAVLLGVDLKKDPKIIVPAYNDSEGVTAQFNLNLLARINRELGADFHLDDFYHDAIYNKDVGRIEMYLKSRKALHVRIASHTFHFQKGEGICTEHSYKFSIEQIRELGRAAGLELVKWWNDDRDYFSIQYLTVV